MSFCILDVTGIGPASASSCYERRGRLSSFQACACLLPISTHFNFSGHINKFTCDARSERWVATSCCLLRSVWPPQLSRQPIGRWLLPRPAPSLFGKVADVSNSDLPASLCLVSSVKCAVMNPRRLMLVYQDIAHCFALIRQLTELASRIDYW